MDTGWIAGFWRIGYAAILVPLVPSPMYLSKEGAELGSEVLVETYYFLEVGRQRQIKKYRYRHTHVLLYFHKIF